MNMESGLLLGSALVSIGLRSSYKCWKNGSQKRLKAVKYASIVMSCGTGKSRLCQALKGNTNVLLVDVDESVAREEGSNSDVNYLVEAKKYVDELRKTLKNKSLLLVCSSIDEAKFLGVDEKNIAVLTPCSSLFKMVMDQMADQTKRVKCEKDRLNLISSCEESVLNIFSSFDELYSVIRATFKLKNKF